MSDTTSLGSAPAPRPKIILGDAFIRQMIELGVVPERTIKVIIEAEVGAATHVHYSMFGDERIVGVVPAEAAAAKVVDPDDG